VHRRPLLELLERYSARHPEERSCVDRVCKLVSEHDDCFERTCLPGHITASAWIASSDHERFLLTHHRKLGRWLQLGGHADGEVAVADVALREAREESGMRHFECYSQGGEPLPIDLDVHLIPARGDEPSHEHHDLRFLLIAEGNQPLRISHESLDLRWFDVEDFSAIREEASLLRLARKAKRLLASL
jgi:8-oxo-dGTP pyrophosphatase MutT (NUDIX family)